MDRDTDFLGTLQRDFPLGVTTRDKKTGLGWRASRVGREVNRTHGGTGMKIRSGVSAAVLLLVLGPVHAMADEAAAKKWIDSEFQPSTLSKEDQMKEMEWFIKAAEPFKGMEINVVSETITTHAYESETLAKAFTEITGIKLKHDLIQEGDVVEKIQTQMQSGKNIYDAWVNDSDLIGTHFRYKQAIPLTDWMAGEGKDVTSPTLDLKDFIGLSFTTAPDGKADPRARRNRAP